MNILYIIGNGLDIAHHMKTSYQDFFKYYLEQPSIDADIQAMKKDIDKHKYETWADLEIGLEKYSSHCSDKDVFLKCLDDIKINLKQYLQKESDFRTQPFADGLCRVYEKFVKSLNIAKFRDSDDIRKKAMRYSKHDIHSLLYRYS